MIYDILQKITLNFLAQPSFSPAKSQPLAAIASRATDSKSKLFSIALVAAVWVN
jgi:hypothetical protein